LKKSKAEINASDEKRVLLQPAAEQIIAATAKLFAVLESLIITPQKGRQRRNLLRKTAMYLCQHSSGMTLQSISDIFGISHKGGVSNALADIRRLLLEEERIKGQIQEVLDMMQ